MTFLFRLTILSLLLFAFSTTSAQEFEEVGFAEETIITRQSNVRQSPTKRSNILKVLMPDDEIRILDDRRANGYLRVLFGNSQQGYVYYKNIKPIEKDFAFLGDTSARAARKKKPCRDVLSDCPTRGCYDPNTPGAYFNEAKRRIPTDRKDTYLIFPDFLKLQKVADERLGKRSQNKSLTKSERDELKNIEFSNKKIGEGSLVRLVGYIPLEKNRRRPKLKAGSVETVNCRLTRQINKDIHIPFTSYPSKSAFKGIVLEMIPQDRHPKWNLRNLRKVQRAKRKVMVYGGLFYDNEHVVNKNPRRPLSGHSARSSLWEIHPITKFLVCAKPRNRCNPLYPEEWVPLENYF